MTNHEALTNGGADNLFLGLWSLQDKDFYSSHVNNFKVLNYHWRDYSKLKKDKFFLDKIYSEILLELKINLNG